MAPPPRRRRSAVALGVVALAAAVVAVVAIVLVVRQLGPVAAAPSAPPSIIASAGVVDPCEALTDGRHELRADGGAADGGVGEVIATRTCAKRASVGFCDIEITRRENPVTLEVCDSATRELSMSDDFTMRGGADLVIRVGGRVRGVDYGTIDVGGMFAADGALFRAYLSGPFEPLPTDRFEIVRARGVPLKNVAERTELPTGGSFKIERTETALVLTDYRAPPDGFRYAPVRAEPFPPKGGNISGSLKIQGPVTYE